MTDAEFQQDTHNRLSLLATHVDLLSAKLDLANQHILNAKLEVEMILRNQQDAATSQEEVRASLQRVEALLTK